MSKLKLSDFYNLEESSASSEAKEMGLVHLGFGNYGKTKDGGILYKTVDGKLVNATELRKRKKEETDEKIKKDSKKKTTEFKTKEYHEKKKEQISAEKREKMTAYQRWSKALKELLRREYHIYNIMKIYPDKPRYSFRYREKLYFVTLTKKEQNQVIEHSRTLIEILYNRLYIMFKNRLSKIKREATDAL